LAWGIQEGAGGAMKIDEWRRKIDAIDNAMLHLLNLRIELALEVGKLKNGRGLALRVPAREHEILSRMKKMNPGPLDDRAIENIYQVILDESIRTQVLNGCGTEGAPPKPAEIPEAAGAGKRVRS
jgi:chorismate mutase